MSKIVIEEVRICGRRNPGDNCYVFDLAGFSKIRNIRPGQFIHLKIPDCDVYFRRAFSVYDVDRDNKTISILFKVFGHGTALMAQLKNGDTVDILGPLGNGFKLPSKKENIIMVAGGVGMPPLHYLTSYLLEKGYDKKNIYFFYGGKTSGDLPDLARIKKLGVNVIVTTDDGSSGIHGLVTTGIKEKIDLDKKGLRFYACGPEAMLKAVDRLTTEREIPGQVSLEAPMPCGIGICLGCIRPLRKGGYTRVCRDGPVYDIGEVLL